MSTLKITIQKPCSANWVNMSPSFNGRFCTHCQKEVIDFTKLSNTELHQYFEQTGAKVCGRFHQIQLDDFVQIPARQSNFKLHKIKVLLISCFAFLWNSAYSKPVLKSNLFYQEGKKGIKRIYTEKSILDSVRISGKVVDTVGLSLPGVAVFLKNTSKIIQTDKNGKFKIVVNDSKNATLTASYIGFKTQDVLVDLSISNDVVIIMKEDQFTMGEVVVVGFKKKNFLQRFGSFTKRLFTAH